MKKFNKSITLAAAFLSLWINPAARAQESGTAFNTKARRSALPADTRSLRARTVQGGGTTTQARLQAGANNFFSSAFQAADTLAGFQVKRSARTGLPVFIRGTVPQLPNARLDAQGASFTYLNTLKDVLRIQNPTVEFTLGRMESDALSQTHQRMHQVYRGVPVYGGEVLLHSQSGQIFAMNGRYFATPQLSDVKPSITQQQAIDQAIADVSKRTTTHTLSEAQRQLLDYQQEPSAQLVIYHTDAQQQQAHLTWHISLRPNFLEHWEYFVDAKTGTVLRQFNHTCSIDGGRTASAKDLNGVTQTVNTYQVGNNFYFMDATRSMFNAGQSKFPEKPVGIVWTLDARNTFGKNFTAYHITNTTNVWNNPAAVSAHYNGGKAFEYFRMVHGRNSINGQGGTMMALINVADEDGTGLDNAFWNGKYISYGNGNVGFKPLAGALDVAGHEMSHGVIQHTANLEYQGQSGAINESMADVFGAMIDSDDWKIGEDVVLTSYFPSGALRDMSDPHNGGTSSADHGYQPRVMAELYVGEEDNGGVHINSGIPNYAFYLFATSVTKAKAEKVYYRALSQYLTAKSQFVDLRLAVVQAATDLYGANSAEVTAAKNAFDQVGIYENGGGEDDPGQDLPDNPGQDYLLVYNANPSETGSFYTVNTNGSNAVNKFTSESISRPSVTDDGKYAYFVGNDYKIRGFALEGNDSQEWVVQDEAIWSNVAISKDGSKLAAVTTSADTAIYVYSFDKQEWVKFWLYNPTTSKGMSSAGVVYADAIEWDYTGEYLIYDAYNSLKKSSGQSISYWDVGVIRVWDNNGDQFGDGKIQKIFSDLPENVSIGNPAFSKKSRNIVAFDYVNEQTNTYKVIAANLQTGDSATVVKNNTLGFPTYSKADDRIAYTTVSNRDTSIAVIGLKSDRITGQGSPGVVLREAKWAVWFAQGDRQVLSNEKDLTGFSFQNLDEPVSGTITGSNIVVTVPETTDITRLIATFSSSPLSTVKIGNKVQVSGATANNFTNPVVYTVTAQNGSTRNYTVTVSKGVGTGVGDPNDESDKVEVFPNPSEGRFKLTWDRVETEPIQLEVVSLAGKVVHQQTIPAYQSNTEVELHLPDAQPGVYFLQMQSGDKTAYKKILVR